MTPLMGAVITAQYEGAAALIACGARQDLRSFPGAVPVSLFCMLLRVSRLDSRLKQATNISKGQSREENSHASRAQAV